MEVSKASWQVPVWTTTSQTSTVSARDNLGGLSDATYTRVRIASSETYHTQLLELYTTTIRDESVLSLNECSGAKFLWVSGRQK